MRTSSHSSRFFVPSAVDMAVGLALLAAGSLVLAPLANAQTRRAPKDSALTGEQIENLKRQLDTPDTTKGSDLWEEYKEYREDEKDHDGLHSAGERVKVGDSIVVEEDERILGDVVSIGGNVQVRGVVEGDVVSVGGDVDIHEGAEVKGDAVSVGGRVEKMGDAIVRGETVSVNVPIPMWGLRGPDFHKPKFFSVGWKVGFFLVGLLLVSLFNAVAGQRLDVVSRRIEREPGQSFLIGLLGICGTPIAMLISFVLLAITIIGLLLFPVLLILVWLMMLGGFAATALAVGRRTGEGRVSADSLRPARSSYMHLLIGFLALHGFLILSAFFGLVGVNPLAILLLVLGICVIVFATIIGYGAVLLSRLGKQAPVAAGGPGAGDRPAPPQPPTWPAPPVPPPPPAWPTSHAPPTTPPPSDVPGTGTT